MYRRTLKYTKRRSDKITLGQFIKKRLKESNQVFVSDDDNELGGSALCQTKIELNYRLC